MGKKRAIKLIALTVAVFTLFTAASGCGNSQKGSESNTTAGPSDASTAGTAGSGSTAAANPADEPSIAKYGIGNINAGKTVEEILSAGDFIIPADNIKFPISQTPITLKIFRMAKNLDIEVGKMPVLQDYEKKTNIHIEWNAPAAAAYKDKFNLMMASGDLPDIIIGFPGDQLEQVEMYGNQGALIDLTSLIDKSAPNVKELFTQTPAIKKMVTTDDGKIYSLPYVMGAIPGNNTLMTRQDWLTKLNLQPPTTTDEWYAVLKAFKTMGSDIWPFSSYGANGTGIDNVISLTTAWGLASDFYIADSDKGVYPKDNKIHYGPIEDRFKEGLEWVIKLYSEGLIDPESVTNDVKAFQAKVLNDKVGAWRGQTNGDMMVLNDTASKNGKSEDQFHIVEMPIMKGPYGDQVHFWADDYKGAAGQQGVFCITRVNQYPNESMQWADYWYSKVGRTFVWGINGVTYNFNEEGEPVYTDYVLKNPEGKSMNEVRGAISIGRGLWPSVVGTSSLVSSMSPPEIEANEKKYRLPELMTRPLPYGLSFSQSESDKLARFNTDVKTYVTENLTNFIIGKKPISEWDSYVAKVKSMGIDEMIKVYQDSYDRWVKR